MGDKRPTFSELLLFGGTGAAGLLSARNIPIFAIISTPIIVRHLLTVFTGTAAYPAVEWARQESEPPTRSNGGFELGGVGSGCVGGLAVDGEYDYFE